MDCNNVNILLNRYESVLSAQMTKSLGKSVINLYSNIACSVLGIDNQQDLSDDLECDPFLKDVHRSLIFFKLFGLTILVVNIAISRKKIWLLWFPGGHFLRG